MNQEHYSAVKEAVTKRVPDILDLKFGCEFLDKISGNKGRVVGENILFGSEWDYSFAIFVFEKKVDKLLLTQDGSNKIYNREHIEIGEMDVEILGRPIRLADVLLAIKDLYGVNSRFAVNAFGIFYEFDGEWKDGDVAHVKYLHMGWNLHKDSLQDQSEETIEFLYSVLIKP